MPVLLILGIAVLALLGGGSLYSRFLARRWGEEASRLPPAVTRNDGRDYVPTPTPVVFAHHFASIAGAGPILGPVIAVCFGWLPALVWILLGGLFIGGVHDYLATFMAMREGGQSVATVARRLLGRGPFLAFVVFLVVSLALVCGTFLNLSATALTSMVPHARLGLPESQTIFRVVGEGDARQVVIGGIASTSVIVITMCAPLIGWLYIRKGVPVWICSLLALVVCAVSIMMGLFHPVAFGEQQLVGRLSGTDIWRLILAAYTLIAAGIPVWVFLQSRDFINVHILYVGLLGLTVTLVAAGIRGATVAPVEAVPIWDPTTGSAALGPVWPALFITIACGAISGFHSLCAGGTTCKQLQCEPAARRVGYWAMLLESFLAVCVVAAVVAGLKHANYLQDVHPALLGLNSKANPILGFAMAIGGISHAAFGVPAAVGAVTGMIMLEGFMVTTLDTAVRLMRYLLEEIWRALFGGDREAAVDCEVSGACGIPASLNAGDSISTPGTGVQPSRLQRFLGYYWVNSGLAVALMLWFAFSSGIMSLWALFATANQLLAAFILLLGAFWLMARARQAWPALIPAFFMLATTGASLISLGRKFVPRITPSGTRAGNGILFGAVLVLMMLTAYLIASGFRHFWSRKAAFQTASPENP